MKIEIAVKKAVEQCGENKKLLKLKMSNIALKNYRACYHPEFQRVWETVKDIEV